MKWFAVLAMAMGACSSSTGNGGDAGPPITAQAYYGLTSGQCFEYTEIDGGLPTLGLRVVADSSGLELHLLRHGLDSRVDYLVFDGGVALLTQQDFVGGQLRSRVYATPLLWGQAPLATSDPALTSQSAYQDSPGAAGTESFEVDVLKELPFTAAAGAFPDAFELSYSAGDSLVSGGAPAVIERRWLAPDSGFVDIYTADDTGNFADFTLVDIKGGAADAGCAAH